MYVCRGVQYVELLVLYGAGTVPFDNGAAPFVNGTEWHRAFRTGTVPFGRTLRKAYGTLNRKKAC